MRVTAGGFWDMAARCTARALAACSRAATTSDAAAGLVEAALDGFTS
jgi:hypothetical protein